MSDEDEEVRARKLFESFYDYEQRMDNIKIIKKEQKLNKKIKERNDAKKKVSQNPPKFVMERKSRTSWTA